MWCRMDVENFECCQYCNRVHRENPCEFCGTSIPYGTPETPERFILIDHSMFLYHRNMDDALEWRRMDKALRPSRMVK